MIGAIRRACQRVARYGEAWQIRTERLDKCTANGKRPAKKLAGEFYRWCSRRRSSEMKSSMSGSMALREETMPTSRPLSMTGT